MNEAVEEEKEEEEEIVSCLCEYTTVIIGRRSSSCGSTFILDARVYSCVGGGRASGARVIYATGQQDVAVRGGRPDQVVVVVFRPHI